MLLIPNTTVTVLSLVNSTQTSLYYLSC